MDHRVKQFFHTKASQITELAQRFNSYYSEDISPKKIIAFLLQFEEYEKIELTFKLISNINFLGNRKITHLIKIAYLKIDDPDKTNPLIAPLGTSQDSSALVCYSLFKDIFEDESNALLNVIEVSQIESELNKRNPTSLILIDDNITSGTQLRDFFDELFTSTNNRELIPNPLSDNSINKLRLIPIYVCYAIRLTKECEEVIEQIKSKYNIKLNILSGASDYYNYTEFSSPIIDSLEESIKMQSLIIEYSKSLYEDKAWDENKLYNRLLGYGNLGKLTIFSHNVPKSLIPFLWKFGLVKGKIWIPLFPERQELKKIERNNYKFETYLDEVANMLLTESNIMREPDLDFYLEPLNGINENGEKITLIIPSDESLEKVLKTIKTTQYEYEKNEFYPLKKFVEPLLSTSGLLYNKFQYSETFSSLSKEKYNQYKKYIDEVNKGLLEYKKNIELYITELSGKGMINLNINNFGIGAANNVRFRLTFNTSEIIFIKPEILIAPYLNSFEVKSVKDFQYSNSTFKIDEMFEPHQYNETISGRKLCKDMSLYRTLHFQKISHRDSVQKTLDYLVISRNKEFITLKYELLWDESIEGISGELKLFLRKEDQNEKKLEYLYNQIE